MDHAGIEVTPEAVEAVRRALERRGTPEAALRFGVRGGGCTGFSYVIEYDDAPPRETDITWEIDGIRFIVDPKSLIYLRGSVVAWKKSLMWTGFDIRNPQEASRCGCGESFSVK